MTDNEWLSNLKAGDDVCIDIKRRVGGVTSIRKVDRLTKTQIIVGHTKFRRSDGRQIGVGGWTTTLMAEPTQERRDEVEKAILSRMLKGLTWDEYPLKLLRKVKSVIVFRAGA